ncbi:hypothetical protein CAMGR0001_1208 [Campylobacter gracilis RM3268]|uniref:Uncharacterized protein n=1 Tax=Campylobacter gracilis RM3268 TaxID=553220 RepID=C8PJ09_9BACT|nr:hypothetical protein CAMGR0001_1208 [Campylobacter gracilis RM3268]
MKPNQKKIELLQKLKFRKNIFVKNQARALKFKGIITRKFTKFNRRRDHEKISLIAALCGGCDFERPG